MVRFSTSFFSDPRETNSHKNPCQGSWVKDKCVTFHFHWLPEIVDILSRWVLEAEQLCFQADCERRSGDRRQEVQHVDRVFKHLQRWLKPLTWPPPSASADDLARSDVHREPALVPRRGWSGRHAMSEITAAADGGKELGGPQWNCTSFQTSTAAEGFHWVSTQGRNLVSLKLLHKVSSK